MIIAFVIWTVIALILTGIGVWSWRSEKAAGFYSGVKPPEIKDVKGYNHAVSTLWIIYAVLFETLGIPLLVFEQNSPGFLFSILGTVIITIGLLIGYNRILSRYRK